MKKFVVYLLVILALIHTCPIYSSAASAPAQHNALQSTQPLSTENYMGTASAVLLYELNTQTLVYAHNPDLSVNPSGLVKLLTVLIVLEEGNLDDVVTVKRSTLNSVGAGAVSAGLKAGEEITLRDLVYCVMVSSANDAAAVIAEHVAGSQAAFIEKMNARAATLGCVNTHFVNVHGLTDSRQYSTARDLAIITAEAMKNDQFRYFFAVTNYTVPTTNQSASRTLTTTNYLMDTSKAYYDERVTGGKPAAATTADRSVICTARTETAEYLCVVISAKAKTSGGAVTRFTNFDEASKLLTFGFDGFEVQQVLGIEQPFGLYAVTDGENDVVVGPDEALYALLPRPYDPSQLRLEDVPDEQALSAPVQQGSQVGVLQVYYGSVLIGQVKLLARHSVALKGAAVVVPVEEQSGSGGLILILAAVFAVLLLGAVLVLMWRKQRIPQLQKAKTAKSIREKGDRT